MSDQLFNIFLQSHKGSWAILLILFVASVIFQRQKVTQMIQRLFYLIMLVSGIGMLMKLDFPPTYVVKGIVAILMIGCMEMVLASINKRKPFLPMLIGAIVLAAIVVLIGYGVISF
ncbi:DUF1516 family protein [Paenibacillus sp. KN14-4R]|uniref:DUF1516 family protein n=1 Tax=Paenibacillus sp. KN14-4R TaxID=3445773 RepID=UPI003F9FF233